MTLPRRPGRTTPPARDVAEYWDTTIAGLFGIHLDAPRCFCCGRREAEWSDFERAHLVDRALGGLDHEANLVLLCRTCHSQMPMFEIDQWYDAVMWVETQKWISDIDEQLEAS